MTLHSTRCRVRVRRLAAILLPPCDWRSLAVGCDDSTKVADAAPRHGRRRHYSRGRAGGNPPLARASGPLAAVRRPSGRWLDELCPAPGHPWPRTDHPAASGLTVLPPAALPPAAGPRLPPTILPADGSTILPPAAGSRLAGIIPFRGLPRRSTAGRPALHGREPGQVRKEAATAILCKCRGNGSPPFLGRLDSFDTVAAFRGRGNEPSLTPHSTPGAGETLVPCVVGQSSVTFFASP